MRTLILSILLLWSGSAAAGDLAGALLGASLQASVEVSSRITAEATSCATTKGSTPRHVPKSCRLFFTAQLDPDVAAQLHREAYDLDGPLLRQVAVALQVDPNALALALIQRAPAQPTEDQLVHLLAFAAPAFNS